MDHEPGPAPLADAPARGQDPAERLAKQLQESERRYLALVDDIAEVIVHVDRTGRLKFVNRAWTELTGLTLEETLGRGALDGIHPDDHALAAEHMHAATRGLDQRAREVRFFDRSGEVRWMQVRGRALFDAEGDVSGFAGVLHDVTERRHAEVQADVATRIAEQARDEAERARKEAERARDEAERALDQAVRASQAKSEFLSRMSHELRTPLNAILGFGQLLELSELAEEDVENVEHILIAGRHLLDLINEVLDVVRIESGKLSLTLVPVEVGAVVSESLDLVRHAATARGVTLASPARHCGVVALADRQLLKQVLINLLANAVKYNRDDGHVEVRCALLAPADAPAAAAEHGWLRLTVQDTGRGIAPEHLQDVFTPFERLGAEGTAVEGTGMGLSVTRRLVEALGGGIGLSSEVGRGSSFWVDLPLAEPLVEVAVPAPREEQTRGTVLYVEDNAANVTLMRRIFSRRPHLRLVIAHDGPQALEKARGDRPDLVLLDLHLPTMSGTEVLTALRAEPCAQLRAVPVVVVTADVSEGSEAVVRSIGATDFQSKPLDVGQLLAVLDQHVPVA